MKNYSLNFLVTASVCFCSTFIVAQSNNAIEQATPQITTTEKTDNLVTPSFSTNDEDKKVYDFIKPNTLITTKEFELLQEEKKKKAEPKTEK